MHALADTLSRVKPEGDAEAWNKFLVGLQREIEDQGFWRRGVTFIG
jgi:hypothetical protein